MEISQILAKCDHTLLTQTATWAEIKAICDDGIKYATASVCIPASFVKQAKEYVGERLAICTVIGFPNGYATTAAKCFMASDAVENGADEVDMVINIGWAKEAKWEAITAEIAAIKAACKGKLLKVIIETCLLTDEEKIALCKCVSDSGADYIKTSTGFSSSGATFQDVALFKKLQTYFIVTQVVAMAMYIAVPTRQELGPEVFPRENVLTGLVTALYRADTSTNVCPSLHVALSLGMASAWLREKAVRWIWRGAVVLLAGLICLSTVFIKQHSVVDFFAALPVCALAEWVAFYRRK